MTDKATLILESIGGIKTVLINVEYDNDRVAVFPYVRFDHTQITKLTGYLQQWLATGKFADNVDVDGAD